MLTYKWKGITMPEDNTYTATSTPTGSDASDSVMPPVVDANYPEPAQMPSDPTVTGPDSLPTPSDYPSTAQPTSADEPIPAIPEVPDATAPAMNNETPIDNGPLPEIYSDVAKKISESHNVLIALSSDPSVDEMAAAIGLSMYLDRLGKRATAIYSGPTPNALEFLKPEETFESTADTLQDFVIALNKEKADHLRYKLDGDYVKIYITPYNARISQDDLEFSYGDFNVDLVLALDVANGIDLDSALREHGRIMHDAVIINITTGKPGKFGEIEWSDKKASSVSEMIAKLLYSVKSDIEIGKEEATAFLTGIVAATNRFSNAQTTPETMQISSKLMRSGANQQLISKNITPDVDNELYSLIGGQLNDAGAGKDSDPTKLDIKHGNEKDIDESKEVSGEVTEKESTLLDDLKAAEESLAHAGTETTPDLPDQPVKIDSAETVSPEEFTATEGEALSSATEPTSIVEPAPVQADNLSTVEKPIVEPEVTIPTPEESSINNDEMKSEKVIAPSGNFDAAPSEEEKDKYGQMLEDALAGLEANPAAMNAPTAAPNPEINGVPEINYMPLPGDEVLPPPPTPPIDMNAVNNEPIEPALPVVEPAPEPLGSQPAMQDQVYAPQVSDPGAFKIPGM